MKQHTIAFFKKNIETLCHGEVAWKETVPVPQSWWEPFQGANKTACELQESFVHIFEIERSEADMIGSSSVRWMGAKGLGFAWSYKRNNRWYYTVVFNDSRIGVKNPETAVQHRAREGRPCS